MRGGKKLSVIMEDEDKILNERKSEARTRSMRKFTRSTGEKRIFLTEAFNDGNFAERRDSRSFRTFFLFVIEIDFNCTKIDSTKINLFPFVPIFFSSRLIESIYLSVKWKIS